MPNLLLIAPPSKRLDTEAIRSLMAKVIERADHPPRLERERLDSRDYEKLCLDHDIDPGDLAAVREAGFGFDDSGPYELVEIVPDRCWEHAWKIGFGWDVDVDSSTEAEHERLIIELNSASVVSLLDVTDAREGIEAAVAPKLLEGNLDLIYGLDGELHFLPKRTRLITDRLGATDYVENPDYQRRLTEILGDNREGIAVLVSSGEDLPF